MFFETRRKTHRVAGVDWPHADPQKRFKSGGGGSAPPPVDPVALGNAQTNANISTAASQAGLNNVNTFSPFGSSQFTAFGTGLNGIGPAGYNLNTTLNPNIQGVFDAQTALARTLAGNAGPLGDMATWPAAGGNSLINFGSQGLSTRPVLSGIPEGTPNVNQNLNLSGLNPIQSGLDFSGLQSLSPGAGIQSGLDFSGLPSLSPGAGIQRGLDFGGLQQLSPGSGIQRGLDFSGLQSLSPGAGIQRSLDFSGLNPIPNSTTDFSSEVKQAQDAAYKSQTQYLDPQFSQRSRDLSQQLADQGINAGTEAYDRAQGDLGRERTLAYSGAQNAATAAGNEEQARLYGEDLSSRQQGVGETQAQGAFANAAAQQGFGQDVTARQQGAAELQAGGAFANAANQQGFGQGLSTRQQLAGELQAGGAFTNAAAQLGFGQDIAARQQGAGELQAGGAFANAANQQGFGQAFTGGQFSNAAADDAFNQAAQRVSALNNTQQQNFSNANAQLGAGEGEFGGAVGNLTGLSPLMDFSGSGTVPTTIGNTSVYPSNIVGAQNSANQAAQNRFTAQQAQFNSLTNGLGSLGGALGFGGNGGLGNALGLTGQGGSIFGAGGLFGPAAGSAVDFGAGGAGSFFTGLGAADAGAFGGFDATSAALLGFL